MNEEPVAEEEGNDEDGESDQEEESEDEEDMDEDMPEAGPSVVKQPSLPPTETVEPPQPTMPVGPPRIMITTSPSPCKDTYAFCEDLKNIFPGGEFFKRPKGRGFEVGRIARWAAKRQYHSVMIVNEDHKTPSESYR